MFTEISWSFDSILILPFISVVAAINSFGANVCLYGKGEENASSLAEISFLTFVFAAIAIFSAFVLPLFTAI